MSDPIDITPKTHPEVGHNESDTNLNTPDADAHVLLKLSQQQPTNQQANTPHAAAGSSRGISPLDISPSVPLAANRPRVTLPNPPRLGLFQTPRVTATTSSAPAEANDTFELNDHHSRRRPQNEALSVPHTLKEMRESQSSDDHSRVVDFRFARLSQNRTRSAGAAFFEEEASRRVYSLSAPDWPRPTTPVSGLRPGRLRSMSSLSGMDPVVFHMHVAALAGEKEDEEGASQAARDAADFEWTGQPQDGGSS
ncbi:hypothetical protein N7535_001570 [Penicillium sp. DV-2018c]|nr:hypothetical protein N7461_005186 [Penicillium sp. DV-2018c]KAJ5582950.1 hypothetical protein N7535_001570 [Penicillium sp. DV-2018c]